MDIDLTATLAEARTNLADYQSRAVASVMDSHLAVRNTTALIADTRQLILSLDHLFFPVS